MGFLSPLFLIGLLAGAVPILLHLFRQQAGPVVPFSAVRFVPRLPMHRTRRRQVQDLVLLALRVAAVALLAVSFARPYVTGASADAEAPVTVIAIDRSFSMSAPGRMERARELAVRTIDSLDRAQRVAVVAFDERAEVLLHATPDRAQARQAVARVSTGFGSTRFDAALTAAAELAGGRPGRVVVVSDLQQNGFPDGAAASVPASLDVDVQPVGPAPENLWIRGVRRTAEGVEAEVRSSAGAPRVARVTLSQEQRSVAQRQVTVPAAGSVDVAFTLALPALAAVAVSVQDDTGYAADNVRYAVLDPVPRRRVLAVVNPGHESDALYLTSAVAAAEGPEGLTLETVTADALASRGDALHEYSAVILLGSRGFDARAGAALQAALDRGSGVLIVAGAGLDWPWLAGQLPSPVRLRAAGVETAPVPVSLAATEIRHPIFHALGAGTGWVGAARFRQMLRLTIVGEGRVLARFTNGAPALVEIDAAPGRIMAFASDLSNQWNDFAVQPAFVPFVHALVQHVASARPRLRDVQVGARAGPEWSRPGIVEDVRDPPARVAVNVDLREAEALQMTAAAFAASVMRSAPEWQAAPGHLARVREREQSWWWYGLLLMLVGLIVESAVGSGRRSGVQA